MSSKSELTSFVLSACVAVTFLTDSSIGMERPHDLVITVNRTLQNRPTQTFGVVGIDDYLTENKEVKVPARVLHSVVAEESVYTYRGETISQVRLYDHNKKGNWANVTIIDGGPGADFVDLHFKSKRGHGIDVLVQLYGR